MKVTEENFNAIIGTDKPVMIDFGATWCGPCKALAPRIEEIEKEYEGRAVVGTADVDECSDLAAQFRIRNVPTVLFFKGGQPVDKSVGLVAKETLVEKLNEVMLPLIEAFPPPSIKGRPHRPPLRQAVPGGDQPTLPARRRPQRLHALPS